MGKKVICYIQAFDCEHTVEAAMQSVLDQTYDNWLCVVLSNGNKNTVQEPNLTYDVIKKFAAKDRRFVVLNKRKNSLYMYKRMLYHLGKCFPGSYICALDADDEYKSDFFERAVSFAEEYGLDIVACGTEILLKERAGAAETILLGRRQISENTIIKEDDYTNQFITYKPFFNEYWGKLFRAGLLVETEKGQDIHPRIDDRLFVEDTVSVINILTRSSAIGILSGTSHKFFQFEVRKSSNATIMKNTALHKTATKKFASLPVYNTYKVFMSFLSSHGKVSGELYEYMQAVLFGWFNDFYTRVLLQIQDERAFVNLVSHLVMFPKFNELMCYQDSGIYDNLRDYKKRKEFCKLLYHTLLCQKGIRNRKALWRDDLSCSVATRKEIDRVAAKLKDTIQVLSKLQKKGA